MEKLGEEFYSRDSLEVARDCVGKLLCRRLPDGSVMRLRISEAEAYRGEWDSACHASRGKTARSAMLWEKPGTVYVYLCYGMHWMLNVITGEEGEAQGVLIRACLEAPGPGRLTKRLRIGRELNGGSFLGSELWLEDNGSRPDVMTAPRVGIDYAAEQDRSAPWRFIGKFR